MDDHAFASATDLSTEIADRGVGCVELLDFYLARVERHNPALNAVVVWQVEQARERARAAAGSATFAWLCGPPRRCAGSTQVYPNSLIGRLTSFCAPARWSTARHDPG